MTLELFATEMAEISESMKARLIAKQEKHGDEWKKSTIDFLRDRVDFMYEMLQKRRGTELEPISLVDMANMSMLLYLRLSND